VNRRPTRPITYADPRDPPTRETGVHLAGMLETDWIARSARPIDTRHDAGERDGRHFQRTRHDWVGYGDMFMWTWWDDDFRTACGVRT